MTLFVSVVGKKSPKPATQVLTSRFMRRYYMIHMNRIESYCCSSLPLYQLQSRKLLSEDVTHEGAGGA